MKKLFKAMAVIGAVLAIGAVGKMDYYTKELLSDYPKYCNLLLYGGMSMMIPAFVYSILEGGK